jgi:hypothetical protein
MIKLPSIVMLPVAVILPVTSRFPVIRESLKIVVFPVPLGLSSMSALVAPAVDITLPLSSMSFTINLE